MKYSRVLTKIVINSSLSRITVNQYLDIKIGERIVGTISKKKLLMTYNVLSYVQVLTN